jgi:precorrin-6B methylase 2
MYKQVINHRLMLADHIRMAAFQDAIKQEVKPGDIVVDIGTGSGILAYFALQAGASKVYAIEQGDVIEEAERLASFNGAADRIVFLKGRSENIQLPEKVDVVISELIGFFGVDEYINRIMIDARNRFLKPGGKMLPSWIELRAIPVNSDILSRELMEVWINDYYGVNYSPVKNDAVSRQYLVNTAGKIIPLAPEISLTRIDLYESKIIPHVFSNQTMIDQPGELDGVVGYFRAGLGPDIVLSSGPDDPMTHWQQTYFPVKVKVAVKEGDVLRFQIKMIPLGIDVFWEWNTSVTRNGIQVANFSQSDLSISKETLNLGRLSYQPVLGSKGVVMRRVLDLCDGQHAIGEISTIIESEFPGRFENAAEVKQEIISIVQKGMKEK